MPEQRSVRRSGPLQASQEVRPHQSHKAVRADCNERRTGVGPFRASQGVRPPQSPKARQQTKRGPTCRLPRECRPTAHHARADEPPNALRGPEGPRSLSRECRPTAHHARADEPPNALRGPEGPRSLSRECRPTAHHARADEPPNALRGPEGPRSHLASRVNLTKQSGPTATNDGPEWGPSGPHKECPAHRPPRAGR